MYFLQYRIIPTSKVYNNGGRWEKYRQEKIASLEWIKEQEKARREFIFCKVEVEDNIPLYIYVGQDPDEFGNVSHQ